MSYKPVCTECEWSVSGTYLTWIDARRALSKNGHSDHTTEIRER